MDVFLPAGVPSQLLAPPQPGATPEGRVEEADRPTPLSVPPSAPLCSCRRSAPDKRLLVRRLRGGGTSPAAGHLLPATAEKATQTLIGVI